MKPTAAIIPKITISDHTANKRREEEKMNARTIDNINIKESPIYKTISVLTTLPQKQQERIAYMMEGYQAGYESALAKRDFAGAKSSSGTNAAIV